MTNATKHQNATLKKYGSQPGTRLFRNNVGLAWTGKVLARIRDAMTIQNPRPVKFGLHVGSSDLIGWRSIEITQDMVGKKVAVFMAVECKFGKGRETKEQRNFREQVANAGGIAIVERKTK